MSEADDENWECLTPQTPAIGNHLYHYTSPESLAAILDNGSIRLSPLSQTNDPCEYNEWLADLFFSSIHEGSLEVPTVELDQAMQEIDRLLRRNVCVACFTLDRLPRIEAGPDHLFHMGWARARMWDQYAKKQTGACLVFDQTALVEAVEIACSVEGIDCERMQGTVNYYDQPRTLKVAIDAIRRVGVAGRIRWRRNGSIGRGRFGGIMCGRGAAPAGDELPPTGAE